MKKITILVLLFAVIGPALAYPCCSPESSSADECTKARKANAAAILDSTKQVLILRQSLAGKNPRLTEEWRNKDKTKMDWRFICLGGSAAQEIFVHKSMVLKYSPLIYDECKTLAFNGIPKNKHDVYYTKEVMESLMTLLYEHKVIINKSDYSEIMSAAKALGFNKLIQKASQ